VNPPSRQECPGGPSERLADLLGRYAAAGLPLTSQRRTLIEVLAARSDHPTVDQIYHAVAERLPEVSRTTVYRSLEVLADLGLLERVAHPGSSVRFDTNMEPHHHFLCTRCDSLLDLPMDAVPGFRELELDCDQPLVVDEMTAFVRGTCARCAAAQ